MKRSVFMISDGTGITIESLTNSLLSQFESIEFEKHIFPFTDSPDKAERVYQAIDQVSSRESDRPLVFMTLVNPEVCAVIKRSRACVFDLFDTFLNPLESELGRKASDTVGRAHAVSDVERYTLRIDAVNYALAYDDGVKVKGYDQADIILIGVSRCGKTPTCLYMALQFGVFAANYPFLEEDLTHYVLPETLRPYQHKLFGLTIDPQRLQQIRTERRPNSTYASREQCRREVMDVEQMYQQEGIPYINSTNFSIEEIATKVMTIGKIERKL